MWYVSGRILTDFNPDAVPTKTLSKAAALKATTSALKGDLKSAYQSHPNPTKGITVFLDPGTPENAVFAVRESYRYNSIHGAGRAYCDPSSFGRGWSLQSIPGLLRRALLHPLIGTQFESFEIDGRAMQFNLARRHYSTVLPPADSGLEQYTSDTQSCRARLLEHYRGVVFLPCDQFENRLSNLENDNMNTLDPEAVSCVVEKIRGARRESRVLKNPENEHDAELHGEDAVAEPQYVDGWMLCWDGVSCANDDEKSVVRAAKVLLSPLDVKDVKPLLCRLVFGGSEKRWRAETGIPDFDDGGVEAPELVTKLQEDTLTISAAACAASPDLLAYYQNMESVDRAEPQGDDTMLGCDPQLRRPEPRVAAVELQMHECLWCQRMIQVVNRWAMELEIRDVKIGGSIFDGILIQGQLGAEQKEKLRSRVFEELGYEVQVSTFA